MQYMILTKDSNNEFRSVLNKGKGSGIAIFDSIHSAEICIDCDVKKPSIIIPLEGIPYGFKEKNKSKSVAWGNNLEGPNDRVFQK